MTGSNKTILAVASAGGHWIQLLRIAPAFEDHTVVFASTSKSNKHEVTGYDYYFFVDGHRKAMWKFFRMFFQLVWIIRKVKPRVIVTTGAAPGLMALIVGRIFSTRNIWIDSIANVDRLSTSGMIARRFSDLYLTQWEKLASQDGRPGFQGAVI